MTLLDRHSPSSDEEALIKEARRLRRRRWLIGSTLTAAAAGAAAAAFITASGPPPRPPARAGRPAPSKGAETPGYTAPSTHPFVPTRALDLIQPTTLATLPNGDLLILDSSRDQILKLTPRGVLSVFAGDGRIGLSGDGGPARNAELDLGYFSSASMVVTPRGSVDFLDDGSCRIRQVSRNGIIRTILRMPLSRVYPSGTSCPIDAFALSPSGDIYLAFNSTIERLGAGGPPLFVAGARHLDTHAVTTVTAAHIAFLPSALTFNPNGDLFIWNQSPKLIFELSRHGRLRALAGSSYAHQLTTAPDGRVFAGTQGGLIQEITTRGVRGLYSVVPKHVDGLHWGSDQGFQEDGIAITTNGTVYVDNSQGNGWGAGSVLVRITHARRAALVPIRTPLAATLPKLGAPGFPASLYPASRPSHGRALASCPSEAGLERFTPQAVADARRIAAGYLTSQFAADIVVTDRSWWAADFNAFTDGTSGGRHTITSVGPASQTAAAAGIARACGTKLVQDSLAVSLGASPYSNFTGTLYLLDRAGHPLVYDAR